MKSALWPQKANNVGSLIKYSTTPLAKRIAVTQRRNNKGALDLEVEHPMERISQQIAQELSVQEKQITAVIKLLGEGATIPFIARYRKELTGGLDDTQLRQSIRFYNKF